MPVYALYAGNGFPTNFQKPYTEKGVTMHISDIFYIFVEMWQCGIIKKYLTMTRKCLRLKAFAAGGAAWAGQCLGMQKRYTSKK